MDGQSTRDDWNEELYSREIVRLGCYTFLFLQPPLRSPSSPRHLVVALGDVWQGSAQGSTSFAQLVGSIGSVRIDNTFSAIFQYNCRRLKIRSNTTHRSSQLTQQQFKQGATDWTSSDEEWRTKIFCEWPRCIPNRAVRVDADWA